MASSDPYPTFTRSERIADAAMHLAGITFAIAGTILLIVNAAGTTGPATLVAVTVYGLALIGSFVASACYHFTPWEGPRPLLRRIDHAAIYLKIAGTYTPLVVFIGSAFGYVVLGVVWALATLGAISKLFFWRRPGAGGVWLYLGLGWISVLLIGSLVPLMSTGALALIAIGGIVYSIGALVFWLDCLRFQNAIWHGFVLTASICFFAAIVWSVTAQT